MRKFGVLFLVIIFMMVSCEQSTEPGLSQEENIDLANGSLIENQYIIVFDDAAGQDLGKPLSVQALTQNVLETNNIALAVVSHTYSHALRGVSANISSEEAELLSQDPRVKHIEQDRMFVLAKPPWAGGGGGDPEPGQVTPWGVARVGGGISSSNVTAWILDSGIDLDHPDLNVDVARSVTMFTNGKDGADANDLHGHGSHVAGTVGAIDNDIDVVGVVPGITLVAVKVLDRRGSGSYSGVIAGVDYVAANASNGDVANMSLGGPVSQILDDAVIAAAQGGVKFALAAGNESDDANFHSPARANHANIYTVSSFAQGDNWSSFSNYGNPPVDFAAPGSSILSTYKNGGTSTMSGTSMASPHVCGLLALGNISADGSVAGDPDGNADPIAHN
ncbi:MAG: S8 family serine peptidase [FCB group bacterium]|nr:S8 family serine peptidase [FCB group bacterium]MBL7027251.1 S8 family serine peptidase [Candidatus Neomarinimicrobiota bacterium]MBL7120514.1 S8 family serine peptidase [Candidatus Neomarinimicrobiota bacterium]